MVLDRIIGQSLLKKQPDVALFIGFVFTLIAFVTSYMIFVTGMSVAMIGFASILILPYIMKIMKPDSAEYTSVFARDSPSFKFFVFLFIGMALAYTILFGVLKPGVIPDGVNCFPGDPCAGIRDTAFRTQIDIIEQSIQGRFAGNLAGQFMGLPSAFFSIVSNNILIVAIAIVLSFFYGSGAIFILNYNASIAGIVYGSSINALIWGNPALYGASTILYSSPHLYLPHTILEILGYLLAAIAGTIISKPLTGENSRLIKRDSVILIVAAVVLILVGGLVEVTLPRLGS